MFYLLYDNHTQPRGSHYACVRCSEYNVVVAMRIHISSSTKEILEEMKAFNLQERGEVEIKVHVFFIAMRQVCAS